MPGSPGSDLDRLREIIEADGTDQQSVNEETWTQQARFLADGDFDGLNDYVEALREEDGNVVETDEPEAPTGEDVERPVDEDSDESAETNAGPNPQNAGGGNDPSDNDDTSLPNA